MAMNTQCPYCGKVFDESEDWPCPYCNFGRKRSYKNIKIDIDFDD